jgi:hypothetical protein
LAAVVWQNYENDGEGDRAAGVSGANAAERSVATHGVDVDEIDETDGVGGVDGVEIETRDGAAGKLAADMPEPGSCRHG